MPGAAPNPLLEHGRIRIERFANGELHARLPAPVGGRRCVVLGSASPPEAQLTRLLLACHTLAVNGAAGVTALLPYLAYARQDRSQPSESLGIAWLGSLLGAVGVTEVVSIDVHSERARELLGLPLRSLSPAPLLAAALAGSEAREDLVVVAPDAGAIERARALADALGVQTPVAHLDKRRAPGGVVHRALVGELARHAIVVDDILDTGETLLSCVRELCGHGVEQVELAVTHGLFTGSGWRALERLGVGALHVTDSVPGARARASRLVHVHSVAPLLEQAILGR